MFTNCYRLETLNLSNFSFNKNPVINNIFKGVGTSTNQTTIYVNSEGAYYLAANHNILGNGRYTF